MSQGVLVLAWGIPMLTEAAIRNAKPRRTTSLSTNEGFVLVVPIRYAARTGRPHNVNSDDLKGALAPVVKQHYAAIVEPLRVGELLRAIDVES